jgi:hypothetical protein
MKGVEKRGSDSIFRANVLFYPERLLREKFGDGEKAGNYLVFRGRFNEKEVYENFNELIREMMG